MLTTTTLHREEIKAQLRMKYGTIEAFEHARGLPSRSVKDVLRGRAVRRTAEAIAQELDVPLQAVSPLYEDDQSPQGDSSEKAGEAHRLNQAAN
jgi:lambda repressor-like predicted transcriptional regulator